MNYKGYSTRIEYDDEANLFHGEVLGIRDVLTFQGTSVKALQRAFHDTVDDYLEFCLKRGDEPDKPFFGSFLIRLSPEEHRRCWVSAKQSGLSLNAWAAEALRKSCG